MLELEIAIFTMFALLLGAVTWRVWQQRVEAEQQAAASAELAVLGSGIGAVAHDLSTLLEGLAQSLRSAITDHESQRSGLEAAARAIDGAQSMLDVLRGKPRDPAAPVSVEGVVRLVVALVRPTFPWISITVEGELRFRGKSADAMRVVHHLILSAIVRALDAENGNVRVHISDGMLSITSEATEPALDDRAGERGALLDSDSSGLDPSLVAAAACIGWGLRHGVDGGGVSFVVEPTGGPGCLSASRVATTELPESA